MGVYGGFRGFRGFGGLRVFVRGFHTEDHEGLLFELLQ